MPLIIKIGSLKFFFLKIEKVVQLPTQKYSSAYKRISPLEILFIPKKFSLQFYFLKNGRKKTYLLTKATEKQKKEKR